MAIEIATVGGGCFWCLETLFSRIKGVESAISGYAGGESPAPTYQQVCSGNTGHAEVVQITFDNKVVDFSTLLTLFFSAHNPTTLNQQGGDVGTQYRSIVLSHDNNQHVIAQSVIKDLNESDLWSDHIVTEIVSLVKFFPAELSHQNYYANNPNNRYCQVVIEPKVIKFIQQYSSLLK